MKRDGFTIVEVMIFLAISGLMLTMAMIGSGNLARQTRFSDSVNSFHSTLQRQYEEVISGVNTRQNTEDGCSLPVPYTGTDSCLLLGKVLSFVEDGKTVDIRYVTGSATVKNDGTILEQIASAVPRVRLSGEESFELPWGAMIQVASRETDVIGSQPQKPGSLRAKISNIAFLRGPNSSRVVTYYFYSTGATLADVQSGLNIAVAEPAKTTGTKAYICISNQEEWSAADAPVAAIKLGDGEGAAAIDTLYEPTKSETVTAECDND